ncbi:MAG: hypothetical protein KF889_19530 [Alphaproteobacteria bacterium]|nr:hypothetical protein [Alphaproteobacteria bacterium]MCW5744032.1 hypothetical protein [Alphaproteobacteria bacterium]
MIENYTHKYISRGKWVFVPNERCKRKAHRILEHLKSVELPPYFFHYAPGGHVAALHQHIENRYFFKIDIKSFYYSIARERVHRALRRWRMQGAQTHAKWSCVRNPIIGAKPQFVLPIGFVQSPLLASLVLMQSPVTPTIDRVMERGVTMSVYLDDIVGSHNEKSLLTEAFDEIRDACIRSEFTPNAAKLTPPSEAIVAFNCDLTQGKAFVTEARIKQFYEEDPDRSSLSIQSFRGYCSRVAEANVAAE